jgi:hypothetical protein
MSLATNETAEFFRGFLDTDRTTISRQSDTPVEIYHDGSVILGGADMAPNVWREGRTGSRVLGRLFRALVAAYPASLTREALCDALWPESDGDRALRNLYAATNDLRRVIATVPGLRLYSEERSLRLAANSNVRFMARTSAPVAPNKNEIPDNPASRTTEI